MVFPPPEIDRRLGRTFVFIHGEGTFGPRATLTRRVLGSFKVFVQRRKRQTPRCLNTLIRVGVLARKLSRNTILHCLQQGFSVTTREIIRLCLQDLWSTTQTSVLFLNQYRPFRSRVDNNIWRLTWMLK